MKRTRMIVILSVLIAAAAAAVCFRLFPLRAQKPAAEGERSTDGTGTPLYDSVEDCDPEPFSYQLKQSYDSYEAVVAEKEALRAAIDEYRSYLYRFLAPIEAVNGYEYAKQIEENCSFRDTADALMQTLEEIETHFPPDERTKTSEIELLLDNYINSQWSELTHDYTEKGRECQKIRARYLAGELSLGETMRQTGLLAHLIDYRASFPVQYGEYLSGFNMKSWFDPDDYLEP